MKEIIALKFPDMANGEMKAIPVDGNIKILLCRLDDKYFALSQACPHYGAPLEHGILHGERIVCPWHHSCFNAKTGDYLEPPATQSLVKYEVEVRGEDVVIRLPDELEPARVPEMVKPNEKNLDEVIILGAGAAGYMAAQTLREENYTGRIKMITPEEKTPYDRPNLSKDYLAGNAQDEWMPLRSEEFYTEYDIEVIFNKKVKELYTEKNLMIFEDGMQMNFSKLIIATGGIPVKLDIPGSGLKNIYYLRSWYSSDEIIKAAEQAKNIVIIGGSFIGMEAAFHIKQRTGAKVTVIIKDVVPFAKVFGKEIGKLFLDHHQKHKIEFILNSSVVSFDGDEAVRAVVLNNGTGIPADLVIAGIGVKPATSFIKDIELNKDGSLNVDEHFCVKEYIYAAGDIASFPDWRTGEKTRIEHWRTALQQGRYAALHLCGKKIPYKGVPFFWTKHGDMSLLYVGHAKEWDEIIYSGEPESKKFIAFYAKNNKVVAAAGMKKYKEMAAVHELFFIDKMPAPEETRKGNKKLTDYL